MKKYSLFIAALFFSVLAAAFYTSDEWIYVKRLLTQPENAGEWPDAFYDPKYDVGVGPSEFSHRSM